jgi:hypothetical protein
LGGVCTICCEEDVWKDWMYSIIYSIQYL